MARTAQIAMTHSYRLPFFSRPDADMLRGLKVAGIVGAVVLAAALAPKRSMELLTVEDVPERFAKLILEEPKAASAPIALPKAPEVAMETPKAVPKPTPKPKAASPRRPKAEPVPENKGAAGRERAAQEVAQLQEVSKSLDKVLADVSASLASTDDGKVKRKPARRRGTRSGRSAAQVASLTPAAGGMGGAGVGAAIDGGARIAVESIAEAGLPAPSGTRGDGSSANRGEIRRDADLLAVVRKYAPGIQFCYDNELKKAPGLGGKLIVSITVAASGRVTDAAVVKDTVRSPAMTACALAQIEAWKFPAIPEGEITFQAPFVFTPPE